MPRGITQDQVNAAADTILGAGENPTVEKVRAELGTGSPNTVTRMLDTWRRRLGERLRELTALPDMPPPVGQAMLALWQLATDHAAQAIAGRFADERSALDADRDELSRERQAWVTRLDAAETALAQAVAAKDLAEHACATLDSQLQDSHALRADLAQQRDRLQAQCDRQRDDIDALKAEREASLASADRERERVSAHIQAVEDHAHREVDLARQEAKQWQQRLEAAERSHRAAIQTLQMQSESTLRKLQDVEKDMARANGQIAVLERALSAATRTPRTKRAPRAAKQHKDVHGKVAKAKSRQPTE